MLCRGDSLPSAPLQSTATMGQEDRGPSGILQVVSGDGSFNTQGVEQFVKDTGVESSGVAYTVVAIMGPQSSGKSTLLNHLVRQEGRLRAVGGVHPQPCRNGR